MLLVLSSAGDGDNTALAHFDANTSMRISATHFTGRHKRIKVQNEEQDGYLQTGFRLLLPVNTGALTISERLTRYSKQLLREHRFLPASPPKLPQNCIQLHKSVSTHKRTGTRIQPGGMRRSTHLDNLLHHAPHGIHLFLCRNLLAARQEAPRRRRREVVRSCTHLRKVDKIGKKQEQLGRRTSGTTRRKQGKQACHKNEIKYVY